MGENMTDLTKITTAFGLLDKETQEALRAHGGPYERYFIGQWHEHTGDDDDGVLHGAADHWVVRVKPQPLTKPSIDWSHVAKEYKWLARDESGYAYIFLRKPHIAGLGWVEGLGYIKAKGFASYTPGTCDWRDSLVERPE